MKLSLPALAAFLLLGFAACKPSHEEMRKQFMKSCEEGIARTSTAQVSKEAMHDYCQCSADKVFAKFSEDELISFNKMSPAEREQQLTPVVQSCLDELQQKVMQQSAQGTDNEAGDSTRSEADSTTAPAAN